jgi:hypothetical protein
MVVANNGPEMSGEGGVMTPILREADLAGSFLSGGFPAIEGCNAANRLSWTVELDAQASKLLARSPEQTRGSATVE